MLFRKLAMALVLGGFSLVSYAQKGETVKIAWIDPLSGLMAPVGSNQLKTLQYLAEEYNKGNAAGVKFEIIGMDNKLSPAESLNQLKAAMDQGVRYITQGNGSSVAGALVDAVNKHNERNPGKEIIFLNHSAVDPDLTNHKCSYWHFRFDADTSMKMEALTTFIKDLPDVKKIYLLNQNYSHGQQVVKYAKETLSRKRPDIQIVGEDLHPLAQVRDFAPYIAKIKASGAHLLHRRHRHANRFGPRRCRPGVPSGLRPLQHDRSHGQVPRRFQSQVQRRFVHRFHDQHF